MQVDRLLSAFKISPAETRSNMSGRYTLLKSHIPWVMQLKIEGNVVFALFNKKG